MRRIPWALAASALIALAFAAPAAASDTLISVGSPETPFSQNKQNEPALAVDQLDGGALDVWDSGELRCARVSVAITLAGIPTAARAQAQSCALRDIE